MDVNRDDIEMIVDTVVEAFEHMDDMRCDAVGLYEYIKDCNEFFVQKKYEPERLCYSAAFVNESLKRGITLEEAQLRMMQSDAEKLVKEYPEYNNLLQEYL